MELQTAVFQSYFFLWENVNQEANMFQNRKMIAGPIAFPTWILSHN